MKFTLSTWGSIGASLLVAACGGGGGGNAGSVVANPARGQLVQSPPLRITSLAAAEFTGELSASASGQSLLQLSTGSPTGALPCGVDVQYLNYGTVGAKGESTTATAALMVPTGSGTTLKGTPCNAPRPIVLFAHGTTIEKRYNLADFTDPTNPAYSQALLLAAEFAAQGYIVVAPNYAGYDSSTLGYHPFLVADQQSKDMMDALAAAKTALPLLSSGASASSQLFVTGYSQGGHVAMATHRALQTAGIPVTASAPMSGPYAMALTADAIVGGQVNLGSTIFLPLVVTAYQKSYGDVYASTADFYEDAYATGIESVFPGAYTTTTAVTSGKVPQLASFNSTPPAPAFASVTPATTGTAGQNALWALGFGTPNLFKNSMRAAYLTDAAINPDSGAATAAATPGYALRKHLKDNDLRSWTNPAAPILLCGGANDPIVYFANTSLMAAAVWPAQVSGHLVTVLDLDSTAGTPGAANPFYAAKAGFQSTNQTLYNNTVATATAAGQSAPAAAASAQSAVTSNYHSGAAPFCTAAARGFFTNF